MSISRLYFKNEFKNLRLHIFADASEEETCIVTYLQDEAMLKLAYVIGKCHLAPIRHMTFPWRQDKVKLPNNFYPAMGQLKYLERRLQENDTLENRYQKKIMTLTSKLVTSSKSNKLN